MAVPTPEQWIYPLSQQILKAKQCHRYLCAPSTAQVNEPRSGSPGQLQMDWNAFKPLQQKGQVKVKGGLGLQSWAARSQGEDASCLSHPQLCPWWTCKPDSPGGHHRREGTQQRTMDQPARGQAAAREQWEMFVWLESLGRAADAQAWLPEQHLHKPGAEGIPRVTCTSSQLPPTTGTNGLSMAWTLKECSKPTSAGEQNSNGLECALCSWPCPVCVSGTHQLKPRLADALWTRHRLPFAPRAGGGTGKCRNTPRILRGPASKRSCSALQFLPEPAAQSTAIYWMERQMWIYPGRRNPSSHRGRRRRGCGAAQKVHQPGQIQRAGNTGIPKRICT